jgi:hypothetical protein
MVKKIISGQTYNTDTATRVHQFTYQGDDCYQGLFQTRHGAFFLWQYDNGAEWGDVKPLTGEEAFKWLEQHANPRLEKYFGPFPEGGTAERRLTVRLPKVVSRRSKMSERITTSHCNRCGRDTSHYVLADTSFTFANRRYEMLNCRGCEDVSMRRTVNISGGPRVLFTVRLG